MSVYVTGGTLGVAVGPLIGAIIFTIAGIQGTVAMVLPGGLIAIFMIVQMRSISQRLRRRQDVNVTPPPIPWRPLSSVIGLMMMRAWVLFGISAFIPLWYEELGYSRTYYAALTTTLLVASALGTVGVGSLADRHGRKRLLVISSILTVPAVLLFAQFPGNPGFLLRHSDWVPGEFDWSIAAGHGSADDGRAGWNGFRNDPGDGIRDGRRRRSGDGSGG